MKKISRKLAIKNGEGMYFTGKLCKHGHVAARYTESGGCRECVIERVKLERKHIREIRKSVSTNQGATHV